MKKSLLSHILENLSETKAFALLYRPHLTGSDHLEVMVGELSEPDSLESIPVPETADPNASVLVLVPYRQLVEREFDCIDDHAPLIAMTIRDYEIIPMSDTQKLLPDLSVELVNGEFDTSNNAYAETVRKIKEDEIGNGEGCNFVIKRLYTAEITGYTLETALSVFYRLLQNERGAYWTFLIHTGNRTFIGASPELHVSLNNGVAMMNPISGTYRYPSSGPTLEGIMHFLSTQKEADELYMVVEEELKMMARFCPQGGKVMGPFLKEMSRLAHTEYFIQGITDCDPRGILHATLFAPTVTGSPIQNACRIIAKHELKGRGYYSGVGAVIGRDATGNATLDSTILIRTAEIDNDGMVQIGIGATIVRHSDPLAETLETWAKVRALLDAMQQRTDSTTRDAA